MEYKKLHPCIDCGESDFIVLDFDHRPGTNKRFTIGGTNYHSLEVIKEEIAKCDIRCANCHRRITYYRRISSVGRAQHL